ncbi:MAG: hypothetical protein SFZ03_00345 [Candidatus Melainabacteria bacterium]|nr:hypothetical protein [Candidatus Melainabacteria bacterium]
MGIGLNIMQVGEQLLGMRAGQKNEAGQVITGDVIYNAGLEAMTEQTLGSLSDSQRNVLSQLAPEGYQPGAHRTHDMGLLYTAGLLENNEAGTLQALQVLAEDGLDSGEACTVRSLAMMADGNCERFIASAENVFNKDLNGDGNVNGQPVTPTASQAPATEGQPTEASATPQAETASAQTPTNPANAPATDAAASHSYRFITPDNRQGSVTVDQDRGGNDLMQMLSGFLGLFIPNQAQQVVTSLGINPNDMYTVAQQLNFFERLDRGDSTDDNNISADSILQFAQAQLQPQPAATQPSSAQPVANPAAASTAEPESAAPVITDVPEGPPSA